MPNGASVYLCIDQKPSSATDVSIGCSYYGNTGTSGSWTQNNSWSAGNTNWAGIWTEHAEVRDGVNTYKSPSVMFMLNPATTVTTSPVSTTATISASPTSLVFNSTFGGANPVAQLINVSAPTNTSWMVSASSNICGNRFSTNFSNSYVSGSNGNGNIYVYANSTGLEIGTCAGNVTISGNFTNSPITIPVTLTVTAPATSATQPVVTTGTLSISPTLLAFTAVQGGANPTSQILNVYGSNVSWNVSVPSSPTWLSTNLIAGTAYSNNGSMYVYANTSGLLAGTYNGNVTISGQAVSAVTVPVTLTITAPTTVTPSSQPPVLSSNSSSYTTSISPMYTVSNLPSNQSVTATFYSFGPAGRGCTSGCAQTVTANSSGTATFTGSGFVSSDAGSWTSYVTYNGLQSNTISYTVTAPIVTTPVASLSVSPTSLSFTATQGSNPSSQVLNVLGGNVSWTVSVSSMTGWLTTNLTGGTYSNNGSMSVSANTASLGAGTYNGTIFITGNGVPTINVPVSVTVTAPVVQTPSASASLSLWAYRSGSPYAIYSNFQAGDTFTLQLTSNQPNTSFQLCSNLTGCITAGPTNSSGGYSWSGTWNSSNAGSWSEWVTFGSYQSPTISFTVSATTANSSTSNSLATLDNYSQMANTLNSAQSILQQMLKSLGL